MFIYRQISGFTNVTENKISKSKAYYVKPVFISIGRRFIK